jgi:hypothetical protein
VALLPSERGERAAGVEQVGAGRDLQEDRRQGHHRAGTLPNSITSVDRHAHARARGRARSAAQGLLDLFLFMRERPDVDLSPHLAKTSPQFRNYIEKGLAQVGGSARPAARSGPADPACEPCRASHGAQVRAPAPDGVACAQVEQRLLAEERQAQLAA